MKETDTILHDRLKDLRFAKYTLSAGMVGGYVLEAWSVVQDQIDGVVFGAVLIGASALGFCIYGDRQQRLSEVIDRQQLFSTFESEFR